VGDDFTPIETRIRKELKIKESDIVRLTSSQDSSTSLGNSVVTNGKWSLAGQPYNCSSCYGSVHLYNNDLNFKRTIVGSTHPDWSKSFGSSVAMSDKHIIVSAYKQSKVYLYDIGDRGLIDNVMEIDGGKAEVLTENRYVSDNPPNSEFGKSVAISDDYAVVTVPQATVKLSSGSYNASRTYTSIIYIYEKDQLGNWKTEKTDRKEITDHYSESIAVSGDIIAMGVNNNVHIYERDSDGEWSKIQTLEGTGSFGHSISISDGYMLIGAPGDNKAYMYEKSGGNNGWVQMGDAITREGAGQWASFGRAVSLSNDYAIIGEDSGKSKGAVTIYKRIYGRLDMGTQVFAPERQDGAVFGSSVSVSDKYAIIGAPGEAKSKNVNVGAAYLIDLSKVEHADIDIKEEEEGAIVQYVWVGFESDYEHSLVLHEIQVMSGDEDIVAGFGEDDNDNNPVGVTTSGVNQYMSMWLGDINPSNPERIPFAGNNLASSTNTFYVGNKAKSSWIKMKLKKKYKVSEIDKVVVRNSTKPSNYGTSWYMTQWLGTFVKLLDSEGTEIRRSHEKVHPDLNMMKMFMTSTADREKSKFKNFYFPDKNVVKYIWIGYEGNNVDEKLILSDIRVFVDDKNILSLFGAPLSNLYPTKDDRIETSSFEKAQDEDNTYTKGDEKSYYEKRFKRDYLKAEHILFDGNLRIQSIDSKVTNYYMTEGASTNWIKINLGDNFVNYEDIQKVVIYTHSVGDTKATWRGTFVKLLNIDGVEIARSSDTVPTKASEARRYKERDVRTNDGKYVIESSTAMNASGDRRKTFTKFDKKP